MLDLVHFLSAKEQTTIAKCPPNLQFDTDKYIKTSESFWKNPPDLWYEVQTKLRELVVKAKY